MSRKTAQCTRCKLRQQPRPNRGVSDAREFKISKLDRPQLDTGPSLTTDGQYHILHFAGPRWSQIHDHKLVYILGICSVVWPIYQIWQCYNYSRRMLTNNCQLLEANIGVLLTTLGLVQALNQAYNLSVQQRYHNGRFQKFYRNLRSTLQIYADFIRLIR